MEKLSNLAKFVNLLILRKETQQFEQLARDESAQSQHDVEVDEDATQPNTENQDEPQQPNSEPINRTTTPQSTRPPLQPNRDETDTNKGK